METRAGPHRQDHMVGAELLAHIGCILCLHPLSYDVPYSKGQYQSTYNSSIKRSLSYYMGYLFPGWNESRITVGRGSW
jgi:hypothetical protein